VQSNDPTALVRIILEGSRSPSTSATPTSRSPTSRAISEIVGAIRPSQFQSRTFANCGRRSERPRPSTAN